MKFIVSDDCTPDQCALLESDTNQYINEFGKPKSNALKILPKMLSGIS